MKKYRVIVDGQEYEVGIEALDNAALKAEAKPAAPAWRPPPPPRRQQPAVSRVTSPMPGNILAVNVPPAAR